MCVTNTTHRRAQALISLGSSLIASNPIPERYALAVDYRKQEDGKNNDATTSQQVQREMPFVAANNASTELFTVQSTIKMRPKRRRKPQKPGLTAKNHERHFVVHQYHDHAHDAVEDVCDRLESCEYQDDGFGDCSSHEENHRRRGGVAVAFPLKLHSVLDQVEFDGHADILSWMPHGRCFVIHKPKEFVEQIMPLYVIFVVCALSV
jgi:hypothetical protein